MLSSASVILLASEGEGPSPLVPEPAEWVIGLVFFLLLLVFLSKKVFPVFEKTFAERREAIEGGMSKAASAQAEADELLAQYRAQLQEARTEASRIRTEAQTERAAIVESARGEAREVAQAEAARGRQQLEAEVATARADLSREVGRLAVELAERIVGEHLADSAATSRTVDRFLEGLSDFSPSGSTARTDA